MHQASRTKKDDKELSKHEKEVVKVLLYFEMFRYPLTVSEILGNFSFATDVELVSAALDDLCAQGYVENTGIYYHIPGGQEYVGRREKGEVLAKEFLKKAEKYSRFIANRPFVRGVMISGSLSKGYMERGGDIDYFIVTEPNRVWFVKAFLMLYKKVFLFNSKKYFCINYIIDSRNLEIIDQNVFTAKEIRYLIPTYNEGIYQDFLNANRWTKEGYLPNFNLKRKVVDILSETSKSKKRKEMFWSGRLGNMVDHMSLRLFQTYWRRKYRKKFNLDTGKQIKCEKHVSKIHPGNYQERVLNHLSNIVVTYEREHQVKVS